MSKEVEFVAGLYVDHPHPKAPDFVKMRLSITRKELGNWLRGRDDKYINIDIRESKNGKLYAAVNNFEPKSQEKPPEDDDLPF